MSIYLRTGLTAILLLCGWGTNAVAISVTHRVDRSQPTFQSKADQASSERSTEADHLLQTASQQYHEGQYEAAIATCQRLLELRRELNDQAGIGLTLYIIGVSYRDSEHYAQAIEAYQQALSVYQAMHDLIQQGRLLNDIGRAYLALSQYADAIDTYQQALPILSQVDDRYTQGSILHNLGIVYGELGNYSKSVEFYQQALTIFLAIDERAGQGRVLNSIGLSYVRQKQYLQAIEPYQQALALHRETGNRIGEGRTLNNLGEAYGLLQQYSEALTSLKQALIITQELGDRQFESAIFDSLGDIYRYSHHFPEALKSYQQALVIKQVIQDRSGQRITLSNLGNLFEQQNQASTAIAFYKQSINVTETIRDDIRKLSQELQQSYTNTIADTYRRLSDLLLSQGRILEAQQVLELLKLQELREFTGVRAKVTSSGIELTPVEQAIVTQHNSLIAFGQQVNQCQKDKCSQLTTLLDQRDQLTQQFNQTLQTFEAQIRARLSQDRAALDTQDFSRSAREIVEAQPGTVMIYALVLDDKLWLLWATAGGVVNSVEVPVTQQKLGETVLQFRQLLSTPNSDITQVQATAKQLYDWLIAPIAPELQKNHIQHLVFSLDRATRYIPMAALFDGQHYLLENYTVSTVLSADLTRVGDRLPPGTDHTSVLAVGLSNAVPPDFPGLPNVPAELNAIVRSSDHPQGIYSGVQFLNQAFDDHTLRNNLSGHQIVHIATHGVFVPGRQDQSYLVLGNGQHMSISSIQELQDLGDVRLVVLSACQTALGEPDQDGIEIAGIAYYFLNGGVNTVMASLWSVNDASTQQLMQHLYHDLARSTAQAPITRAEALRQAQLSLLQGETNGVGNAGRSIVGVTSRPGTSPATPPSPGLSHPYYWAPFILIGNGL